MAQKTRMVVVACLAAVMAALVAASPIGQILERELGQYFLIQLRGPVETPPGIVVVAQDYASAAALGLPNKLQRLATPASRAGD